MFGSKSVSFGLILNENNYNIWHPKCKQFLIFNDVWTAIIPGTSEEEILHGPRAKAIIMLNMDEFMSMHVHDCITAKEVWDELAQINKSNNAGRLFYLHKELNSIQLGPDESIMKYSSRILDIRENLEAGGQSCPTYQLINAFLNGLPTEYDTVVKIIITGGKMDKLNDVISILKSEEQNLKETKPDVEKALYTKLHSKYGGGSSKYQGSESSGQQNRPRFPGNCFFC